MSANMESSSQPPVLVIDDEDSYLRLIGGILEEEGLSVTCCSTAADALVQLKAKQFFAVVVDLCLPDCGGIELVRRIKTSDPRASVIVHTAFGSYDSVRDALNLGVFAYVDKLSDTDRLVACVRRSVTGRLHAALDETRQQYAVLWNCLADALILHDLEGRLLDVNQSACDLLGYSRDELLERGITDIEVAPDLSKLLAHVNNMRADKPITIESRLWHKDQTQVPVEVRSTLLKSAGHTLILASARDITERWRAQQRIERLNRLKGDLLGSGPLRKKLTHITDAVVEIFEADFARVWVIQPADACDSGCVHAEVTGNAPTCQDRESCLHLIASSGRYTHTDGKVHRRIPLGCYKIGRVAAGEEPGFLTNDVTHDPRVHDHAWARELGLVSFAGHRLVSADGTPIGVLALFSTHALSDSDRVLLQTIAGTASQVIRTSIVEEALRSSERELQTLFDQAPAGYHELDIEGHIVRVNQTELDKLGYAADDMLGRPVWEFAADQQVAREAVMAKLTGAKPIGGAFERMYRRKDGAFVPVLIEDRALPDAKGQITGIRSTMHDITERKRAEQDLHEANARLEQTIAELKQTQDLVIQQERLRALGTMASGIAHDLNNTLSPIIGYAEMLLSDPKLPERTKELVRQIETAGRDAAAVVDRLRQFYRPDDDSVDHEVICLTKLLETIPMLTRPKWYDEALRQGRTIDLELQLEDDVRVTGNAAELREMITNFVFNAVDAMTADGRITLALRVSERHAIVEISDTGVGMSEEVACRCFEPFFTSDKEHGTGLGLSVCHGIVERHHGSIAVDTQPGQGTTFRVLLPRLTDPAATTDELTAPHMPGQKVLYIDDDHRLCEVASQLLTKLGHAVDVAHSGADGIELVRAHRYDVVVTDLAMPGINGRDVTRIVKSHRPETPVILVTGWDSEGDPVHDGVGEAPECVVLKPLTGHNLQAALWQVLGLDDRAAETTEGA